MRELLDVQSRVDDPGLRFALAETITGRDEFHINMTHVCTEQQLDAATLHAAAVVFQEGSGSIAFGWHLFNGGTPRASAQKLAISYRNRLEGFRSYVEMAKTDEVVAEELEETQKVFTTAAQNSGRCALSVVRSLSVPGVDGLVSELLIPAGPAEVVATWYADRLKARIMSSDVDPDYDSLTICQKLENDQVARIKYAMHITGLFAAPADQFERMLDRDPLVGGLFAMSDAERDRALAEESKWAQGMGRNYSDWMFN